MATEKQINVLKKAGLSDTEIESLSREEVSEKIGEILKKSYGGEKKAYTPKAKTGVKKTYPNAEPFNALVLEYNRVLATAYIVTKKLLPEQDEGSYEFNVTFGMVVHDLTAIATAKYL